MLTKKDLIYFASVMIWTAPTYSGTKKDAIEDAKIFYNHVFNESND